MLGGAAMIGLPGLSAASSPTSSAHPVRTIHLRTHQLFLKILDTAKPNGPSTGDEAVEKEILFSGGRRIGYDLLHFSVATVDRAHGVLDVVVQGALVVRDGTINLQGETTFHGIRVGVTGGTGAYQHVMGQLTVLRTLPDGGDLDVVQLIDVGGTSANG
jgi:hypothetical protein